MVPVYTLLRVCTIDEYGTSVLAPDEHIDESAFLLVPAPSLPSLPSPSSSTIRGNVSLCLAVFGSPKRLGNNFATKGFSASNEAHIIPVFASTVDHVKAAVLASVQSFFIVARWTSATRARLTPQTLFSASVYTPGKSVCETMTRSVTHKKPRRKTNSSPSFCRRGSRRPQIAGIGNSIVAKSSTILIDAVESQYARKLMQWPGV